MTNRTKLSPKTLCTTPDPSGEYYETRGCRPQDVRVSSLRPDSQRSAKVHDDDDYDEPTRLKTMVCPGRPKTNKDEVRRRTERPALQEGGGREGSRFDPPKSGSAAENAEVTVNLVGENQPHHAPPTPHGGAPRSRDTEADNAEMTDWSATTNHTTAHPHLMGGHQRTDPTRRGRQNRSSAMGDRSAHNVSGVLGPSRGRDGGPGDGGRGRSTWSLGPRWGKAGRAKLNVFLFCLGCLFCFFVWRLGGKEIREPRFDERGLEAYGMIRHVSVQVGEQKTMDNARQVPELEECSRQHL